MFYDFSVSKIHENGHTVSLSSIALPKFFEFIFTQMIGTVNTFMLSGYSQEAVAATSVANQIQNLIIMLINIIISGMMIIMSVELGKESRSNAGKIAGTAFFVILLSSLIIGIAVSVFSEQLIGIMNLEGNPKKVASGYFRIRSIFLFITILRSLFTNLLICNGYAANAFVTGLFSSILNAVLCYIILYSGLDLPLNGVNGVAVASIIAQIITLFLVLFLFIKKKCPFTFVCKFEILKRILRVGIPSGLGMVSFTFTQVITTGFMASLGVMTLNAKVYASNIINYTSKVGYAVSSGNGVLVGRYRGRNDFDSMKILHKQNMRVAVISNLIFSIGAYLLHKPLISIFTTDADIISLAGSVMLVDIIVEIARAVNNISEQSLNANGDVKTTFIAPLITCWLFGVLLSYILGIKCGLGLIGCWIGFAADEVCKAILYIIRWKNEKWKNTEI